MDSITFFARADQDQNLDKETLQALQRINEFGPYGYRPNLAGAVIFCTAFGLLAIVSSAQGIVRKRWWLLGTLAFGAWCECIGNGIRIYGHFHPAVVNPYIAQQVILVLTPAFFAAAHFTILTKVAIIYGPQFLHPIQPSWLIPFFVFLDVASLAVQGGGSGLAAVAEINGDPVSQVNTHAYIVVAGLSIQLAGYVAFNALFFLFLSRVLRAKRLGSAEWLDRRMLLFLSATWLSAILVLGRSIFRTAEMALGWVGQVATTEWYYLVFDASLVTLAVLLLTAISPAKFMPRTQDIQASVEKHSIDRTNSRDDLAHRVCDEHA